MTHTSPSEQKKQERIVLYTPDSLPVCAAGTRSSGTSSCCIDDLQPLAKHKSLQPFAPVVLAFFSALSKALLKTAIPELTALGYWLRASNIKRWQNSGQNQPRLALGVVVHFAPANVDTMFVYSWACSLLMGNSNIVRLSSQDSVLKSRLLQVINQLYCQPEFADIATSNAFVTYEHNTQTSTGLSSLADARIIWGGDDTVAQIRRIPAKLRTRDICFADRYSVAVINGELLSDASSTKTVAELLWRDIQPYSQMACSSPRTLFFKGSESQLNGLLEALEQEKLSQPAPETATIQTRQNDHLIASQLALATGAAREVKQNQAVTAVRVKGFSDDTRKNLYQWHVGDGFLYISQWLSLEEVANNIDEQCQTMSYYGVDLQEIIKAFHCAPITQVDRIVPLGQSLDFSPVWDGYDLLNQLSRQVVAR